MIDRRQLGARLLAISLAMVLASGADALAKSPPRRPDLGDAVQGDYDGDVISDSQGSGRDDVRLTVTRVGKNRVEVTSNYGRLPVVTVSLERAMDKIVQRSGDTVFLYDPGRGHLDVTFEGVVSWSGARR